jgi:hypothetical protein
VPFEPGKVDQPARHRLAIRDQVFVVDIKTALRRQHRASVVHQPRKSAPDGGERTFVTGK